MPEKRQKPEKPDHCECCSYVTNEIEFHEDEPGLYVGGPRANQVSLWLCNLCSGSMAGHYARYPQMHPQLGAIGGLIMNAANHIIAEIRRTRS